MSKTDAGNGSSSSSVPPLRKNGATAPGSPSKGRETWPSGSLPSTPSSKDDDSDDVPYPFSDDSQSSLNEDDDVFAESFIKKTFSTRVRETLHLPSRYPEGYSNDVRPKQVVHSLDYYDPGYGKVASFQDCDPSFLIFRKFGWLHRRLLLHIQDEITQLEDELEMLDKWELGEGDPEKLISRRSDYNDCRDSKRKQLLNRIKEKLDNYDDLITRTQKLQSFRRPSERAQRNFFNFIKNTKSLVREESTWIRHGPDLAALAQGSEHGWLNEFVEDCLNIISRKVTTFIFRSHENTLQAGGEEVQLLSPYRIDILIRVILTVLASGLLLAPVAVLFELELSNALEVKAKSNYQMLTVFLFTLVFSASCSVFTRARRQEVFMATAAYCAVLVVFLGNTNSVVGTPNGVPNQGNS